MVHAYVIIQVGCQLFVPVSLKGSQNMQDGSHGLLVYAWLCLGLLFLLFCSPQPTLHNTSAFTFTSLMLLTDTLNNGSLFFTPL